MILDVTPQGSRIIRGKVECLGAKVFSVYTYAPEEERRSRIRKRQPGLTPEEIDAMILGDPVSPNPLEHQDFDLVVSNGNGEFEEAAEKIERSIRMFLV